MKTYIVKKGQSDFKPRDGSWWPTIDWSQHTHIWQVKFLDSYLLKEGDKISIDQKDWNKGGGFTYWRTANNKSAVMWVWRWNQETKLMEIGLYINDDRKKHSVEKVAEVPLDKLITIQLTEIEEFTSKEGRVRHGIKPCLFVGYSYENKMYQVVESLDYPVNFKFGWTRRTGLWFGGNKKAPSTVRIKSSYKRKKNVRI